MQHDNLVVYDNDIRTDFLPITADYLLFTSPLNIRAYVNQQGIPTQARIISIGHTTGTTLTQLGLTQFRIAQQPNEDALLDCLLDWETNTSILRTQKDDPETY